MPKRQPITHHPEPIRNDPQPSKPRAYRTHTDDLPQVFRPGATDAHQLPRVTLGWRIWPDGRKEKA